MDSKVNIRFNVTPISSPQNKKGKLEVKIEGSSPDAIAKHYELTGGGNNDTNLLSEINKVVAKYPSFAADSSTYKTPDDLIEAIGTDVFNKQAQNNLKEVDLNIVRELYLLLKVARKIHSDNDKTITYSMFGNFERTNRYNYGNDKTLTGGRSPKKTDGRLKTETAWTSYFKDVLAYESTRDGGKKFNKSNMFKNIEIKNVESVSGMPEGRGNPSPRNVGDRSNADSLDEASDDSRRGGDSVFSDSKYPFSDSNGINSGLRSIDGLKLPSTSVFLKNVDGDQKLFEGEFYSKFELQDFSEELQLQGLSSNVKVNKREAFRRWKKVCQDGNPGSSDSGCPESDDESVNRTKGLEESLDGGGSNLQDSNKRIKQKEAAAVRIQAVRRGYSARAGITNKQKGAIKIQCAFRSFQAKSVLRKKREQKEVEAAKKQIENRIFMQRAFEKWREVRPSKQSEAPSADEGVRALNRVASTSHSLQVDLGQQSIRSSSSNSIKRATQKDNEFYCYSDSDEVELVRGSDEGVYSSFSEEGDGGINLCDIEMSLMAASKERYKWAKWSANSPIKITGSTCATSNPRQ